MLIAFGLAAGVAALIAFYSLLVRNAKLVEEENSGVPQLEVVEAEEPRKAA